MAIVAAGLLYMACSDKSPVVSTDSQPLSLSQGSSPNTSENVPETVALESDLKAMEADAELRETWIARIEPYVSENSDGTYNLDETAFQNYLHESFPDLASHFSGNGLSSDASRVIEELTGSIPVVNKMILNGELDDLICGHACWNYWWGRRCCYWGSDAHYMIFIFTIGGIVPPLTYAYIPFAAWAQYLTSVYGGFCTNMTWIGGGWLTAP